MASEHTTRLQLLGIAFVLAVATATLASCGGDTAEAAPEDSADLGRAAEDDLGGEAADEGSEVAAPSAALSADLLFLREEEKLARDTYQTLYERHGSTVLQNIAGSEQRHMDSVKTLLDTYGLTDPAAGRAVGEFVDGDLAELYSSLVASGTPTEQAAMVVGATIEDLDIHDIQAMRLHAEQADVLAVLESLECGSRNHLRAFLGRLTQLGGSYAPQYISQTAYDEILASPHETCGGEL